MSPIAADLRLRRLVPSGWLRPRAQLQPTPATIRLAVGIAAPAIAYHYSLLSLLRNLHVETPLAYLGLVPIISLVLAASRAKPAPHEPAIHDRQVDYIIGFPLLAAALGLELLLPVRLSTMFWVWRLDLLSLPLFVAGTVSILFGVRALWRLRVPVAFLFLAWPLPYSVALLRWLDAFTGTTLWGVKAALNLVPVAEWTPGSDGSLFVVGAGAGQFTVSVASACSGVNGVVGYLLIGLAFMNAVVGAARRKALWLVSGLAFIWFLNVVRIVIIFATGHQWGEAVAIDGFHPVIGLVTFNLGVLAMVLVLGHFGLGIRSSRTTPHRGGSPGAPRRPGAVPGWRLACGTTIVMALSAGVANASLRSYDLVASTLGTPRLAAFVTAPSHPLGWRVSKSDEYTWARRFFGDDSKWVRWRYDWGGGSSDPLRSPDSVISDVIQTADLGTFSTYGLEACYRFHGFKLRYVRSVDLGGGVVGNVLSYYNTKAKSDWTTVYWHWPVQTADGTRYERVTLMLINSAETELEAPLPSPSVARSIGLRLHNALGQNQEGTQDQRLARIRGFAVAFAADVIRNQQAADDPPAPGPGPGSGPSAATTTTVPDGRRRSTGTGVPALPSGAAEAKEELLRLRRDTSTGVSVGR